MTPRLKAVLVVFGTVAGMFVLLIGIALFTGNATKAPARGIDHAERAKQRAWAQDAKLLLIQNHTITKFDCAGHEVQADGPAWSLVPLDTKKGVVETLSRICEAETSLGHVTLVDNRSGRELAKFSVWSGVTLR